MRFRARVLSFAFLVACSAFGQSITATKAYVDRRYTEATNDICAIVTNEVAGGWSEWRKNPGWKDPPDTRNAELVHAWDNVWDFRYEDYWRGEWIPSVGNYVEIAEGQTRVDAFLGCWFEREWIPGGNALGLAMAKDLEKLPTHETVTNVARAVSNSFWDDKNEVLWRMEFRDGEPMFVPVTNENVKATGGVL